MASQEEVPLGNPDILVCSVGTEIFFEAAGSQVPEANQKWIALLDQGWNREIVVAVANKFSGLSLQVICACVDLIKHQLFLSILTA